jgi:hypothetical protein
MQLPTPDNGITYDVPPLTSLHEASPWYSVWSTLGRVLHPPLYTQSLRLWREVFGDGTGVAITYSALWSCVELLGVYAVARLLLGRALAFWCGLLVAVAPTQIYYGLEIRGYVMLAGLSAWLTYAVCRICREGASNRLNAALGVLLLLMMLTHYFAAATCFAAVGLCLWHARREERWRVGLAVGVAAAVYGVIWAPFALQQWGVVGDAGFLTRNDVSLPAYLANWTTLPLRVIAETRGWSTGVGLGVGGGVLLAAAWAAKRHAAIRPISILAGVGMAAFLVQDLLQETKIGMMIRYAAVAAPPLMIMLVATIKLLGQRLHSNLPHIVFGTAAAAFIALPPASLRHDSPQCFTIPQALAPRMTRDQTLIIYGPQYTNTFKYAALLDFANVPGLFPRDILMADRPLTPAEAHRLRTREAWIVQIGIIQQPDEIIPGAVMLETVPYTIAAPDFTSRYPGARVALPWAVWSAPGVPPAHN